MARERRPFPPEWYAHQAARRKNKYKKRYELGTTPKRWHRAKYLLKQLEED